MKRHVVIPLVLSLLSLSGVNIYATTETPDAPESSQPGQATYQNALSDLIERHGCDTVKGWGIGGAQRAFGAWSNYAVVGAERGVSEGIMNRGVLGGFIENMDHVLKGIEVLEEAACGDCSRALRIAGEATATVIIATVGGPLAIAVPVLLELNKIAAAVNREISGANVQTFANMAESDPALLGPNRVEHFLSNYLYWEQEQGNWDFLREVEPNSAGRRLQMAMDIIKKRAALIEYVRYHMNEPHFTSNLSNFPAVQDWREGNNRQMVRVAAAALLQDVDYYVQVRQQQRILMAHSKTLRRDAAAILKFSRWWQLVKGVTCGADLISLGQDVALCVENANKTAELLAEAEGIELAEIDVTILEQLEENVSTTEQRVDAAGPELQDNLEEVSRVCERGEEEWLVARESYDEASAKAEQLTGIHTRAVECARLACSAQDYEEASRNAESAESEVAQANSVAGTIQGLISSFSEQMPPEPIDFDLMLSNVRDQKAQAALLQEEIEEAHRRRRKLDDLVFQGTTKLSICPIQFLEEAHPEASAEFREVVADLESRLETLKANLDDAAPLPEIDLIAGLVSQATSNESWLLDLSARQEEGRACLSGLTEMWDLALDFRALESIVRGQVQDVEDQAAQAGLCARELSGEEDDEEGGGLEEDLADLLGDSGTGEGGAPEGGTSVDELLDDPDIARIYEELVEAADALDESTVDLMQLMRSVEASGGELCADGTIQFLFYTTSALDALVRAIYADLLHVAAPRSTETGAANDREQPELTQLSWGDRRRVAAATLLVNQVKDGYANAVAELERFDPACDPDEMVRQGGQVAESDQDPETGIDGESSPVAGSGDGDDGGGGGGGGGDGVHYVKSGSPTSSGSTRVARCWDGGQMATLTITLTNTIFPDEIWPNQQVTAGVDADVDLTGPWESASIGFIVAFLNPDNVQSETITHRGSGYGSFSFTADEDDFAIPTTIISAGYGGAITCQDGSDEAGSIAITQVYMRVGE